VHALKPSRGILVHAATEYLLERERDLRVAAVYIGEVVTQIADTVSGTVSRTNARRPVSIS